MKKSKWLLFTVALALTALAAGPAVSMMCGGMDSVCADSGKSHAHGNPMKSATGVVDLQNKVCPISGEEVDGETYYEQAGLKYGLCCSMCKADLQEKLGGPAAGQSVPPAATGHEGHIH